MTTGLIVNLSALILFFALVDSAGLYYQIAWLFSYIYAVLLSYLMHNYLTFNLEKFDLQKLKKFILSYTSMGLISFIMLLIFVEFFMLDYLISQVFVLIITTPVLFFYQSRNIFKQESEI